MDKCSICKGTFNDTDLVHVNYDKNEKYHDRCYRTLQKAEESPFAEIIKKQVNDIVNHPSHYTTGEIEVIDYIVDKLTPEQLEGYCVGNSLKYISRYRHKNGIEDLKKAVWYLNYWIKKAHS